MIHPLTIDSSENFGYKTNQSESTSSFQLPNLVLMITNGYLITHSLTSFKWVTGDSTVDQQK